ncbi:MAG: cytochrome B [Bacteroidia bacterium]|nr:cytochrome B [Bacteroidia bacterium]
MDTFANILKHAHSGFRWLVLGALLFAIVNALMKWQGGKEFKDSPDRKLNTIVAALVGVQFLIGLILFFVSPKVVFAAESMSSKVARFFLVEHSLMMLIAVVLISIGSGRAKKADTDAKKFKTTFIFFLIGLLIILLAIPWPWQGYGAGWS